MNRFFTFGILFFFATACFTLSGKTKLQSGTYADHEAQRRLAEKRQGNLVITDEHIKRRLASANSPGKWRRMKIWFDLTELKHQNTHYADFYQKVFDLTGAWWENAVWIKDNKSHQEETLDNLFKQHYVKEFHITKGHGTWKDYDLLVHAHMAPTDGTTLAWAGPMYRHPDNQRPITGEAAVCWFGHQNFIESSDAVNRAVGTMVHEFGHVMAFIQMQEYHKHFVNLDHDTHAFMWTGLQVRERASEFYGCKLEETKGIALQKINNKPGAHWSESTMHDELMTPYSGAEPEKVSPMLLAFMEDTFWYKADYSYVENYTHNKGDKRACAQKVLCNPIPACKLGTSNFVTSDYKGIGYCGKDENGCPIENKYSNQDLTHPKSWDGEYKQFGGDFGSKSILVQGNFIRWNHDATSYNEIHTVPIRAICRPDLKAYTLYFKDFKWNPQTEKQKGDAKYMCTSEGHYKFNCNGEYCSEVHCYDPEKLCKERYSQLNLQKGKGHCHISCMSNGRCQPGLVQNTPNANLLRAAVFSKLKMKDPKSRRFMRRLFWDEGAWDDFTSWGNDHREEEPKEKTQPEIPPAKPKKSEPVEKPQSDTEFKSNAKEYSCWCYSDGKRKYQCPSVKKNWKQ